jgi:hypothetical protein
MNQTIDDISGLILDSEVEILKTLFKPIKGGMIGVCGLLAGTFTVLSSPYILAFTYNNNKKLGRLNDINPELYQQFFKDRFKRCKMPIPMHWVTDREISDYTN